MRIPVGGVAPGAWAHLAALTVARMAFAVAALAMPAGAVSG